MILFNKDSFPCTTSKCLRISINRFYPLSISQGHNPAAGENVWQKLRKQGFYRWTHQRILGYYKFWRFKKWWISGRPFTFRISLANPGQVGVPHPQAWFLMFLSVWTLGLLGCSPETAGTKCQARRPRCIKSSRKWLKTLLWGPSLATLQLSWTGKNHRSGNQCLPKK